MFLILCDFLFSVWSGLDYCSTLDGDDSYSCWKAYFELKDLEVSF